MTTRTPPQVGDLIQFTNDAGEIYAGPVIDVLSIQFTFLDVATQRTHFLFFSDEWESFPKDSTLLLPNE